jgi:peptidoglycan/LPS O-acetylase OafA/YrhL
MTSQTESAVDERFLASGDEAGTAPDDRKFRPDVEGLRALAVGLVVLYHAGFPRLTGGYVGVDVFFVISGFVITGLLLRERTGTGKTSILDFYARRARRILPAATLVILVTVVAVYVLLGSVDGNNVADDGRWAAVFLANYHFLEVGTNYLQSLRPPSPLQHFWSLSVEEQFYVVFPTLFLVVAALRSRFSTRLRMVVVLAVIVVGSFAWSVVQTSAHPAAAYFSPFTRAWELALGGLIAVSTPWLKKLEPQLATVMTWGGLAAILYASFHFNAFTAYPGSAVAVPVLGAGLIIAGGVAIPRHGAEVALGWSGAQWLGRRSYSLYLWHWPVLIIAMEYANRTHLSFVQNIPLILVAVVLSMATYRFLENPVRHLKVPSRPSVLIGGIAVVGTVVVLSVLISLETVTPPVYQVVPAADTAEVTRTVAAATQITTLPKDLEPSLSEAGNDWAAWNGNLYTPCADTADINAYSENLCALGDLSSTRTMIAYGDSHTIMWLPAYEAIAKAEHLRLFVLVKYFCPAARVTVVDPPGSGNIGGPYVSCIEWHNWVIDVINAIKPVLVVASQDTLYKTPVTATSKSGFFSDSAWQAGVTSMFDAMKIPDQDKVFLGNIPMLPQSGPACLSQNPDDVQACSAPVESTLVHLNPADKAGTEAAGARYVETTPWFCSATCTAVVKNYNVYLDQFHVTGTYAKYLTNALAEGLGYGPVGTASPNP